ncbi:hypothetical protein WJ50_04635 [Burkholderia ubonensis]|nr:hypothetical protein WJ48_16100 [Burkholderia ubonensis]KVL68322.1 hypothetical protein WJ49_27190 [Burkholderia ubonensis]KVL96854.1 hypothetical protein WJ50_04635 [Burkholderia ubonensis]
MFCDDDLPVSVGGRYTHSSVDGDDVYESLRDSNVGLDDCNMARCMRTRPELRLGVGANGEAP